MISERANEAREKESESLSGTSKVGPLVFASGRLDLVCQAPNSLAVCPTFGASVLRQTPEPKMKPWPHARAASVKLASASRAPIGAPRRALAAVPF